MPSAVKLDNRKLKGTVLKYTFLVNTKHPINTIDTTERVGTSQSTNTINIKETVPKLINQQMLMIYMKRDTLLSS